MLDCCSEYYIIYYEHVSSMETIKIFLNNTSFDRNKSLFAGAHILYNFSNFFSSFNHSVIFPISRIGSQDSCKVVVILKYKIIYPSDKGKREFSIEMPWKAKQK